jgi:hypothetical protein
MNVQINLTNDMIFMEVLFMNYKMIDDNFLAMYPLGLGDPDWIGLGKKHNPDKIIKILHEEFSKGALEEVIENELFEETANKILKLIKKSTTVSVFEKVAFQHYIEEPFTHEPLVRSLYNLLHHFSKESFDRMAEVLAMYKSDRTKNVAKWPVITFFLSYYDADNYSFVKPRTVKTVAKNLEIDIDYKPMPNYETYMKILNMVKEYRDNSEVVKNENLMIAQAVLFVVNT